MYKSLYGVCEKVIVASESGGVTSDFVMNKTMQEGGDIV